MHDRPSNKWFFNWLPAFLIMGAIFIGSSTPSWKVPDFGPIDLSVKKLGHFVAYSLLALAYLRGLHNPHRAGRTAALILCVLFAVTDEVHQAFVPGRNAVWFDVVIDTFGAVVGLLLWSRLPLLQRLTRLKPPGKELEPVRVPRTGD
jgi:hypothetical protein